MLAARHLLLLIAFVHPVMVPAQDRHNLRARMDSLKALTTDERIFRIIDIAGVIREEYPPMEGERYMDQLFETAEQLGDKRMYAFVLYCKGIWANISLKDKVEALSILAHALKYAEENDCINEKAEILMELGIQNRDLGFYETAFSYFLQAHDFIRRHDYKVLRAPDFLVSIGDFYYRMGYYEKAAEYFTMYPDFGDLVIDDWHKANYFNTAGLTFKKLKQYDKAIDHFRKSLEVVERDKIENWVGLLNGNIGSVHYEMGDVHTAIPLLEKDLELSVKTGSFSSAANASQLLGKIFFEQGYLKKAEQYYEQALKINIREPRLSLVRDVNEGLSNLYRKSGDNVKALEHYRIYVSMKDSIDNQSKVEELKRMEIKFAFEKQEQERIAQIESLRNERASLQDLQRVTVIVMVLLLSIVGLAFYAHKQRSQRKREVVQQELEFSKRALSLHMEKLLQKTNMVEELSQQLNKITGDAGADKRTELITRLTDSTILTETDWIEFRKIFEQVHHGFFSRLRQRYADLTEGEIRLMALLKLNQSSRDISNMLGISIDSVNKSRYRLRKKIGIGAEANLEEFITTV